MSFKNGSKVWKGAEGDTSEFVKRYKHRRLKKKLGEVSRKKNREK